MQPTWYTMTVRIKKAELRDYVFLSLYFSFGQTIREIWTQAKTVTLRFRLGSLGFGGAGDGLLFGQY